MGNDTNEKEKRIEITNPKGHCKPNIQKNHLSLATFRFVSLSLSLTIWDPQSMNERKPIFVF